MIDPTMDDDLPEQHTVDAWRSLRPRVGCWLLTAPSGRGLKGNEPTARRTAGRRPVPFLSLPFLSCTDRTGPGAGSARLKLKDHRRRMKSYIHVYPKYIYCIASSVVYKLLPRQSQTASSDRY